MKGINKERLRAFILRRKINALGLLIITFMSAITTVVCALRGFDKTSILAIVTVLLVILCFIQEIKLRKSFRTIHKFKGFRKKRTGQHT
ncbi:MAG: hypothetical protein IKL99_05745 [Oscillospiraceae bacterium]|nr:hypothetical protein [Oscillospiraceae bacterium]